MAQQYSWRVEAGGCRLAVAGWRLEAGGWRIEVGGWGRKTADCRLRTEN
jgi:hypothetical protein